MSWVRHAAWVIGLTSALAAAAAQYPPDPSIKPPPRGPSTAPSAAPTAPPPASAPSVIDATDTAGLKAALHQRATVKGTVYRAELSKSGKVFRISFKGAQASKFNAVILERGMAAFKKELGEDYAAAFQGKTLTITGTVEEYQGNPQIVLNDPAQVHGLK